MKILQKKTSDLIPYINNARTHTPEQIDQVAASIKEFGFCNPVLIDKDGGIIAGHCRVLAAKKLGFDKVPTITLGHLTDTQRKAYILADNKLALNAGWDEELLKLELEGLEKLDFDLDLIGFGDELDNYLDAESGGLTDDDEVPEPPEELITKPGDIWILGNHRVMCGDSTKKEDVERLMAGDNADMVFTDPPYGVSYEGKTKDALTIENDEPQALKSLIKGIFDGVDMACRRGAYLLATVPAGPLHLHFASDWIERGWLRQILVWNKDSMVLGHSEYHYKHEPILFGWIPGDRHKNTDRTKTTVWDFDRPKASREHPTMKPVEMLVYGIENHTLGLDSVYDPCCGSGSTLIACEKTNRKCYGMEIDPKYCDVIVNRWQDYTGEKASLAGREAVNFG